MTDILTGRENQIYTESAEKVDGWERFRRFTIDRKETESTVITSFYLKPADDRLLPAFLPRQYITVPMPTPDGSTTMRNYSLSDKPGHNYFRISVKKEPSANKDRP